MDVFKVAIGVNHDQVLLARHLEPKRVQVGRRKLAKRQPAALHSVAPEFHRNRDPGIRINFADGRSKLVNVLTTSSQQVQDVIVVEGNGSDKDPAAAANHGLLIATRVPGEPHPW